MAVDHILAELKALAARPLAEATAPPKGLYHAPEILAREQEKVFAKGWLCAGREDDCLLYTSPSPRDRVRSRMPSSA